MKKIFIIGIMMLITAGAFSQHKMDEIPESVNIEVLQKANIYKSSLSNFRAWLANKKGISERSIAANHVLFRWPMRVSANYDDMPDYYLISNYMDENRDFNGGGNIDWYCGSFNYRYHEGNDYNIYPFYWRMMNNDNSFACAAAPGIVIGARDNVNNSYNCMRDTFENNSPNYVAILHSDSSITRYLHVKMGSVKVVEGQFVEEGHILATIASSGHTSNPHLHFDLKYFRENDNSYDFINPFVKINSPATDCNDFTTTTWWKNQKNYIDPKLMRVMTHYGTPSLTGNINFTNNSVFCPEGEDAKPKNQFSANDDLIIGTALAHCTKFDSIHQYVYYPNGTVWLNLSRSVPDTRSWYREIYLTYATVIPANAPAGTYTIKTDFTYRQFDPASPYFPANIRLTTTSNHYFTVGCVSSKTLSGNVNGETGQIVSTSINSTQVIQSGKTRYQSANYIQLNPGFNAVQGSVFKARIRSCDFCD